MTFVWVIIGAVVLLALLSGGSKGKQSGPVRINHPHVIDDDDYEFTVADSVDDCIEYSIDDFPGSGEDLDLLTIGLVLDIWTEKGNDKSGGYRQIAQQSDFDAF